MSETPLCGLDGLVNRGRDTECSVETGSFRKPTNVSVADSDNLLVLAYNIENNGNSRAGLTPIIDLFNLTLPDILLLTEVSRGCGSSKINGAREVAQALEMDYAYSVAFIQEPFRNTINNLTECTNGNAILSRFELVDVQQLVFSKQCCMFGGRAGNRGAIRARIRYKGKSVSLHAVHLESGTSVDDIIQATLTKSSQGRELASIARSYGEDDDIWVIGGDMNSPFKALDPSFFPFRNAGLYDAHGFLRANDRTTYEGIPTEPGFNQKFGLDTLDYIFVHPRDRIEPKLTGVCHNSVHCHGFSDHTSLWTSVRVADLEGNNVPVPVVSSTDQFVLLKTLSTRNTSTENINADWLWIYVLLFLPFILLHVCLSCRRVIKNYHALTCFEDISKQVNMRHYLVVLVAMVAVTEMIIEGGMLSVPYARNLGTWSLVLSIIFCSIIFSVRFFYSKVKSNAFVVMYIIAMDTWGTSALFSSLTHWFWFAWPTCRSGDCMFRFPELVTSIVLPVFVCLEFLYLPASVRTDYIKVSPNGSYASLLLLFFLSFDWISNRESADDEEYFYAVGYYIFAPDTLFAIVFWIILFFCQYILVNKLLIHKLLLRTGSGIGSSEVIAVQEYQKTGDTSLLK